MLTRLLRASCSKQQVALIEGSRGTHEEDGCVSQGRKVPATAEAAAPLLEWRWDGGGWTLTKTKRRSRPSGPRYSRNPPAQATPTRLEAAIQQYVPIPEEDRMRTRVR